MPVARFSQRHGRVRPDAGFAILAVEPVAIDPIDPLAGVEHPQEQPIAVQIPPFVARPSLNAARRQFACHDVPVPFCPYRQCPPNRVFPDVSHTQT